MQLQATHTVDAPIHQAFEKLNDPAILQLCLPGCESMERTGEDQFSARLSFGLGALKGKFAGKVRVSAKDPPHGYTLQLEGNGPLGFVKGTTRIELQPRGEKTDVSYQADVQVGGMIAAIGSRMVEAAGKSAAAEFFARFGRAVRGAA